MWNFLEGIFATYHGTGYELSDFVYVFSPDNPRFLLTCVIAALTFAIGFIEYIYSFLLVRRESSAPYNIEMHTFYFAIDSMGIFVFATASHAVGGFWVFTFAAIAEVIWSLFEVYNLVKCVYLERKEIWGDISIREAWWKVIGRLAVMIVVVNLLRIFMNDPAMFKWYIFTNILYGNYAGPVLGKERNKKRCIVGIGNRYINWYDQLIFTNKYVGVNERVFYTCKLSMVLYRRHRIGILCI